MKLQSAGSGARHRTTEGAEAATRPQTRRGRVTGTIVAVVSFVAIGGVLLFLFSLAEGALDWIADDAPPSAQLAFSVSLLAVGIGWATRTSRRLRGAARYPGIIHRCDSRGEGGWTGVLAVTLPDGSVVLHPLHCGAAAPRKRRASPVILQAADGHLLQPGEPTSFAVRAILATWTAMYGYAGIVMFFGLTFLLLSMAGVGA